MTKNRVLTLIGLVAVMAVFVVSFSSSSVVGENSSIERTYAQGPTPTPASDPVWIAFSTAREALENQIKRNIQFVQNWTWADTNFGEPISSCRTLDEDEQPDNATVGYRFTITLLDGRTFEIRTRFDASYVVICDNVTQGPAAAQAAPAPAPAEGVAAPVAAPVGRGGLEVGGQITGLFPEAIAALNSAGMRWIKIQAKYDRPLDQVIGIINEAHAGGFKVLVSTIGEIPTVMDPAKQDEFAARLAQMAAAGADAIEVWNEPNIEREWPNGQISGANYTQVLAKSYNAIKQANPGTIVISGAPAPTGFFGAAGCTAGGCNDDVFYQQMAAAGAANYMDCVGVHYNEGVLSPTANGGDPRGNYGTYYYSSNLARALGPFPGKQACITEIGYLSPEGYGGLPGNFAWAGNTSVAQHAQWLGEAVSVARRAGNVRLFIVFNVNFTTYTDDPQAGYAMIRPDGSCPACGTIRAALQ